MIKNYRFNIIVRVLFLLLFSILLAWVLVNKEWFFTPLVLSILIVSIVISLIYYVEKTSRNLSLFLLNIKQGGFSNTFKNRNDATHSLYKVFDDVIDEFHKVTIEKESHYQYLQTLNENIGVGLISYDNHGKVDLYNRAAKLLLKKPSLISINDLNKIDSDLHKAIEELKSGERKIIKTIIDHELIELSVLSKKFIVQEKEFTLLILQNIHAELEQKELEAWQKLISVLTHEIMNSVTPIASLSEALNKELEETSIHKMSKEDIDDFKISLSTIELRSKGLMRFVNAYKEFTKSPELNISEFDLANTLERITKLLENDFESRNIQFALKCEKNLLIKADSELLEQVIINLLKNAIEAVEHTNEPSISVKASKKQTQTEIIISDNGSGISKEQLDKIFVPFFTTKKKGSGIGLSFAKKVMRLHNGGIKFYSNTNDGTSFTLKF
ncbi:sensor histidine kinase [Fulvivirga lutea]|uniref:histidine kinase n=1 Tax=Fulvivirga lutea TaxID=2810512 RepID=A0A975A1Z4_9BACT|nr:ATP-binding protein [Fulvivirga lutea]QSE97992.1 GHKL domain-containing protein [Fulvivirga lutea]